MTTKTGLGRLGPMLILIVILLALLVLAIKTWGLVALGLTAIATVPVVFLILFLITIGK